MDPTYAMLAGGALVLAGAGLVLLVQSLARRDTQALLGVHRQREDAEDAQLLEDRDEALAAAESQAEAAAKARARARRAASSGAEADCVAVGAARATGSLGALRLLSGTGPADGRDDDGDLRPAPAARPPAADAGPDLPVGDRPAGDGPGAP